MGKLKDALIDIEDDLLSIARDGAGDAYYMLQDQLDQTVVEMLEFLDNDDREAMIAYLGLQDEDELRFWAYEQAQEMLSEEGISV